MPSKLTSPLPSPDSAPATPNEPRVSRKMSLSEENVPKIKAIGKRYRVTDTKVAGLSINVGATGRKTWQVRLPSPAGNRQVWVSIGSCKEVSSDLARKKAKELWGAVSKAPEAIHAIRAKRGEECLSEIVDTWLEKHIKVNRAEGTYDCYSEMMQLYVLKAFGKRKLEEITPALLLAWHRKMGKSKRKTAADISLRTLSSFFRWAIEQGKCATNPARDVPRHNSKVIHRPLDTDGRRKVGQTIQEMMLKQEANPIYLKAIQLTMATGLRRRNIAQMRWKDINFETRAIKVRDKSFRVQGEKAHPLGPIAIAILKSIPRLNDSPYVFPGRDTEKHVGLATLNQVWIKVRTKAGVVAHEEQDRYGETNLAPSIRLHDLRHTKGAVLGANHPNTMVAATMGLSTIDMANRYGKPVADEIRQANDGAETTLGEDLGIVPEMAQVSSMNEKVSAQGATAIVIQVNWPFQGCKPNKPRCPPRSKIKKTINKANWPNPTELQELVLAMPVTEVAKRLGVSDKAVSKRCEKLGLSTRPRGYWAKAGSTRSK